jgi:hypothetical protein
MFCEEEVVEINDEINDLKEYLNSVSNEWKFAEPTENEIMEVKTKLNEWKNKMSYKEWKRIVIITNFLFLEEKQL